MVNQDIVGAHPRYWLNTDVFCADVSDGLIFLDLNRNRYQGLSGRTASQIRPLIGGTFTLPAHHDAIKALLRNGILTSTKPPEVAMRCPPAASAAIHEIDLFRARVPIHPTIAGRFIRAYVPARIRYQSRSLRTAVAYIRSHRGKTDRSKEATEPQLLGLMSQFVRLRALTYTTRNHCLLDSLVLDEFMRLNRIRTTFVLGVTSRPFRAHCWVQTRDWVLNDSCENVSSLSPILAV